MGFKSLQIALLTTTTAILLAGCDGASGNLEQAQKKPVFIPDASTEVNPATSMSFTPEKTALLITGDTASITFSASNAKGGGAANSQISLDTTDSGLELRGPNVITTAEDGTATANVTLVRGKLLNGQPYTVGQQLSINAILFTAAGNRVLEQPITFVVTDSVDNNAPLPDADFSSYKLAVTASKQTIARAGDSVTLTFNTTDATGGIVTGVPIRLSSTNIDVRYTSPSTITTDNKGIATTTVITPSAGTPVTAINVTGTITTGGIDYAKRTTALTYASTTEVTGRLSATVEKTTLNINGDSAKVTFKLSDSKGGSLAGLRVELINDVANAGNGGLTFSTASTLITNSSGEVTTTVNLNGTDIDFINDNLTSVMAKAYDSNNNLIAEKLVTFNIIAAVTATATVSPEVLLKGQSSTMTVTVRDPQGNPVQNALVNFSINPSNITTGVLSNTSAVTNSSGQASTVYTAQSFSSNQIVKLIAELDPARYPSVPEIEKTLNLTAVPKFLKLEPDTTALTKQGNIFYGKEFAVVVSDAEGQPIKGQTVRLSTALILDPTPGNQTPLTGSFCHQAILDNGGTLGDTSDDEIKYSWGRTALGSLNSIAGLDNPSEVVDSTGKIISTLTTDDNGLVSFYVRYPRRFANWASVNVTATAELNDGNATPVTKTMRYDLQALAADIIAVSEDNYNQSIIMRPNTDSPYGTTFTGVACP